MSANAENAFERVVQLHTQALLRLATAVLHSTEDARDVCQEVFLRYFERAGTIDNPRAWLYRATLNQSINLKKKRATRATKELALVTTAPTSADPNDELETKRKRRLLRDAIAELPPGQRSAFVLRQRLELPIKEIAGVLGVSEGTVKQHLSRAVNTLCARFADT